MEMNSKLNWKQVVGVIVALFLFQMFFEPIQRYVLTHPTAGVGILVAIGICWFGYSRLKRRAVQA